jgi:hypothetical protein
MMEIVVFLTFAGGMFTGVKLLKSFGAMFYMLFKECFAALHCRPSQEIKLLKSFGPIP